MEASPGSVTPARMETSVRHVAAAQLAANTCLADIPLRRQLVASASLDTLLSTYARCGMTKATRSHVTLIEYLTQMLHDMPGEEKIKYIDTLYTRVRPYKSKRLELLIDMMKGHIWNDVDDYDIKTQWLEKVVRKARRLGDADLEAFALHHLWGINYYNAKYARSFFYMPQWEDALTRVSPGYHGKAIDYFSIGMAYYTFKNYDRAIPLMHKAVQAGGYSLRPWNYLAIHHHRNGQLDSAAYYHNAIIASPETREHDPMIIPIALCNLGRIEMERGHLKDAQAMLETGLDYVKGTWDTSFIVGLHTSLGECYLAQGDTAAARRQIVAARDSLPPTGPDGLLHHRLADLYALQSRYYARKGQYDLEKRYQDSAFLATTQNEQSAGRHIILLGEQQLQEAEAELQREEISRQRTVILYITIGLALITIALIVIIRLYRKRDAAYRVLAQKALQWATGDAPERGFHADGSEALHPGFCADDIDPSVGEADTSPQRGEELEPVGLSDYSSPLENNSSPLDNRTPATPPLVEGRCPTGGEVNSKYPKRGEVEEDLQIVSLADRQMTEHHIYRDPTISMDSLADMLGVRRNTLSRAINRVTGSNFNQYLNSYRVKEAVRIISTTDRTQLYLDELSERVGYNSRASFYRAFRQFTGLSPLEFQKKNSQSRGS